MRFGEKLKKLRQKHSISGYKLGILTKRPRQFISNIENGHRPPPDDFLKSLAGVDIFNISYDELKAWALEDKYTKAQIELARKNFQEYASNTGRRIPLIQHLPIEKLFDEDMTIQNYAIEWVLSNNKHSEKAFAVKVSDNGMSPIIELNDIVIIEPVQKEDVQNNHIYIFQSAKPHFLARTVERNGNEIIIYPLNYKEFSHGTLDFQDYFLLGEIIEVLKTNLNVSEKTLKDIKRHYK